MTDLDLGLFPSRGATPPPRRRRRLWIRRGITFVVCMALLVGMIKLIAVGKDQLVDNFSPTRDYKTTGTGTKIIEVATKDTISKVASTLHAEHVVRTAGAFEKAFAAQSAVTKIQPGYYQLRLHMSAASAVALLLQPASKLRTKVTIPEGTTLAKTMTLIAAGTSMTVAQLQAAAANPKLLDLPDWTSDTPPTNLEGFLYPATYQFDPSKDALAAFQQMVAAFSDETFNLDLEDSQDVVNHSPYEVLTVASIIEKEAGKPSDGPKVARVIYNRLAKKMKLQLDSTLNYVLPQRKGHLSKTDLQFVSPFNTYLHPGLPPTPIDSPGAAALNAALNPADGNWTFFVTVDKKGDAEFTNSYPKFLQYKALAKANGVIS